MDIGKLRQLKGGVKGGLTISTKELQTFIERASSAELLAKRTSIRRALDKIANYNDQIYALCDDDILSEEMANDMAYEEDIEVLLALIDEKINSLSKVPINNQTNNKTKSVVKLPALTLPKFGGDPAKWTGF